jgi:hypothetical protein
MSRCLREIEQAIKEEQAAKKNTDNLTQTNQKTEPKATDKQSSEAEENEASSTFVKLETVTKKRKQSHGNNEDMDSFEKTAPPKPKGKLN